MKIKLSDHFTYNRLLRFTLPSVVMMVVASIYSVVDGLFVSNLVGDLALSAVNIIFPVTARWARAARNWHRSTSPCSSTRCWWWAVSCPWSAWF